MKKRAINFCLVLAVVMLANLVYGQSVTQFKKHVITNDFISEGVAVGDVNHDGKT
ncbi:MAG: VCBS repeat-containing protein, partial [Mucilaginibacter sp.]|nr:VCBS repeat-containing protein [Mucilaginibacter sp.]